MLFSLLSLPERTLAAVFDGGGVGTGIGIASGIIGITSDTPRTIGEKLLVTAVSFMALIAVIAIVVGGIYLIAGMGTEQSRDKAKKIILYTVIGLTVLVFARAIVGFFAGGWLN